MVEDNGTLSFKLKLCFFTHLCGTKPYGLDSIDSVCVDLDVILQKKNCEILNSNEGENVGSFS